MNENICGSRISIADTNKRMLHAVGSRSGIACADACIGVANRILANGRRPFAELWGLLTAEGYCTSAVFMKFTHR